MYVCVKGLYSTLPVTLVYKQYVSEKDFLLPNTYFNIKVDLEIVIKLVFKYFVILYIKRLTCFFCHRILYFPCV